MIGFRVPLLSLMVLFVAAPSKAQMLEPKDAESAQGLPPKPPHPSADPSTGGAGSIPEDRIETSQTVPPGVVEVTTLDPQGVPLPQVAIELIAVHGPGVGNLPGKQQRALSDDRGKLKFTNIATDRDSKYRIFTVVEGVRSGTRAFAVESTSGTKASIHVYPIIRDLNQAPVIGKSFLFVEPREEVIYLEVATEFYNLGASTWVPDKVDLSLPYGFTAFASNEMDPNVSAKATALGVRLVGALTPGQHQLTFSFQLPRNNEPLVDFTLPLWPRMAEVRVATVARTGIDLSVEGYPETQLAQTEGQAALRMTGRVYTKDVGGPPKNLHVTLRGLPVTGQGRLVAAALAALLSVLALVGCWTGKTTRQGKGDPENENEREALERLIDELADLERAHQQGLIGNESFAETQQVLVAACIRLERRIASDGN